MTRAPALVVIDPDGHPGIHRAGRCWDLRDNLVSPKRPTSEREIRERGWERYRCRTCLQGGRP